MAAVRQYVMVYETPATTDVSPSAQPSGPADDPITVAAGALDEALAVARQAVADGCPQQEFLDLLTTELASVTAEGPIAQAVLARLIANLTGTAGTEPSITVGPTDDLRQVVATAAPGAIVYLNAGDYSLPGTLVLLDAITLVGEGRDATRLRSSADEVAVLVMTSDLVGLRNLTLQRDVAVPGSGIVTSGGPTLVLEDVRIAGARAAETGGGGAGLDLTGGDDAAGPGRTTVEMTRAQFDDNSWAGISVAGGQRVSVQDSEFTENGECGACFLGSAEGSITGSRFRGNGVGVAAVGTSVPVVRGNRISGGEVGVQVGGKAQPTIDDNRISKAKRAAVIYTDTAGGVLRKTICSDVEVGIALAKTALPSLMDNTCTVVRAN
ncbi:MAG: right-handed parallel beta-helix repeat-containing protein [Propionibacteriaceae bacterium]|nr:right-handed parallel beta-helix repeat-containing protein [Propionibacteriaceae bacterium]